MIPKKLAEQRDELGLKRGTSIYAEDFDGGFDAACAILLPEMEKMKEALKMATKHHPLYTGDCSTDHFMDKECDCFISEGIKALQSYKEVMGE